MNAVWFAHFKDIGKAIEKVHLYLVCRLVASYLRWRYCSRFTFHQEVHESILCIVQVSNGICMSEGPDEYFTTCFRAVHVP